MEDSSNIPEGYCQCGCGEKTSLARQTSRKVGYVKGRPMRFLPGHAARLLYQAPSEQQHREWWAANAPEGIPYSYCWCGCGQKTPLARRTRTTRGVFKGKPMRFIRDHHNKTLGPEYIKQDFGYDTPCWIWQKGTAGSKSPYGQQSNGGKSRGAHRLYYEKRYGPIPKDEDIHHLCEQTLCVNPDHLQLVTRTAHVRLGARAKLTLEKAEEIRRLYATLGLSQVDLGKMYGVTDVTISLIVRNKTWRAE